MVERKNRITLDLDKNLAQLLEDLSKETSKTKSEILRASLVLLDNCVKYNKEGYQILREKKGEKTGIVYLGYWS